MRLSKLSFFCQTARAEKEALQLSNRANLTRIASALQQQSNTQLLHSIGDFLS